MPTPTEMVILRAGVATAAALVGAGIGVSMRNVAHSTLCGLVSLAAGALLAVTAVHIVPEAAELISTMGLPGWFFTLLAVLAGLGTFYLVGKYVYYMCPACAATASERQEGYLRLGVLMIVTLTLHSMMDGLAIAAGYEHHDMTLGALILVAVSYHKVPEGLALVSVCRLAGFSRLKALLTTLAVEMTTALGALLGTRVLAHASPLWLGVTLGFVAGSFLYTVGFATLKEMLEHERGSIIAYALTGAVSILVIRFALVGLHLG
ncbi:MAG TPA: ZIP family metal transporter [Armatimonadota bacterium]|jgi:ZIP family zinc transporter